MMHCVRAYYWYLAGHVVADVASRLAAPLIDCYGDHPWDPIPDDPHLNPSNPNPCYQ